MSFQALAISFEALTIFATVAVNLAIGIRLVGMGRRSGARPEWLLGWALTFDGIEWALWYLAAYTPAEGTPLGAALGVACRVGIAAVIGCLAAFTREVFRRESRAARFFVHAVWIGMFGALAGSVWARDWHGWGLAGPWVWIEHITQDCVYIWMMIESGRYYLKLKRRAAHGLADPVVTNRILLWTAYAGWILCVQVLFATSVAIGSEQGDYPAILDAGMAAFTLFACSALWLAFMPPPAYKRWIAGSRPA